ncbi:MAG: ribonuclease III [Armatimonadetes bacterium]|nr:ribonuclease III [Armatimonadota bacterium]
MNPKRLKDLQELQDLLGAQLRQQDLLNQSLTHTSYVGEGSESRLASNQRLEFLGDSVLGLVISNYLFDRHPELSEGQMTKIKAAAVSEPILCQLAQKLNLGNYILLGRGEETTGGRQRPSILSDTFEAVVAALYLDVGFEATRGFLISQFAGAIEDIKDQRHGQDYKSLLQEKVQEKTGKAPLYQVVQEIGPDHDKRFVVEVCLEERVLGRGYGSSKKEAEQAAASEALNALNSQPQE